jgi:hypothetical protein
MGRERYQVPFQTTHLSRADDAEDDVSDMCLLTRYMDGQKVDGFPVSAVRVGYTGYSPMPMEMP